MADYDNRQQLANHADDEGGLHGLLRRGTRTNDLPEDDGELKTAWQVMQDAYLVFDAARDRVAELLPEPCEINYDDGEEL